MSSLRVIAPGFLQDFYASCVEGRYDRARELQEKASHIWQLFKVRFPAPLKAAMEMMGRPVGKTRLPIMPLQEDEKLHLRNELKALGILDQEPHGW